MLLYIIIGSLLFCIILFATLVKLTGPKNESEELFTEDVIDDDIDDAYWENDWDDIAWEDNDFNVNEFKEL